MKELLDKLLQRHKYLEPTAEDELRRQVNVLYGAFTGLMGPEKMVLRAGKYSALAYIHSEDPRERLTGLQRLIYEDSSYDKVPTDDEVVDVLNDLENVLAEMLARQAVEERLEKKISRRMDEKQQEYVQEIKMQLIQEELHDVETPQTKEKLERLESLDKVKLAASVMEKVRPRKMERIVGQERAVEAMCSKVASVYPQHILLYGPPGVGKTTAARIILEEAKKLPYTPFSVDAPFVETDGTTLRWDAHGGILFIDEIGEMDPLLLNKLLKVLEDKRVKFDSAYYDASDPAVPAYIRKLFAEGAPADFILIGATTRSPQEINPAIRSRCAEVYFEPLNGTDIQAIVRNAAHDLSVSLEDGVAEYISEFTVEGRKAINLLADMYGYAVYKQGSGENTVITLEDAKHVVRIGHFIPYAAEKASSLPVAGKVFGLGVSGYLGSVIEIEAVAFPAREAGKGYFRFNDTAGSMAKDSLFNAAAVVRAVTGKEISDFDINVNFVGGGQIDGPSAGTAVTVALISALTGKKVRQDAAVTGEISVSGQVRAVGGIFEKAYGASRAGMKDMIIPAENKDEITKHHLNLNIHAVTTIQEVMSLLFVE